MVGLGPQPVSSSTLAGYMLYYGPTAGNYTTKIDVGNTTSSSVSNLTEGATYHFAVTAYDASHTESGYSNDVATTIPSAAPVANFTASATSGVAPFAMNFTSTSTGSISTYAWTFGDGTTSSAQNPSHVYSAAGVYTVGLTVTGSGGSSTKTMPNYVTVTAPTSSDTSPPTAPSSLVATAGGTTSINLSWKASTDNVGVSGYRIERCQGAGCTTFTQIATAASSATTYSSTGLTAGTSYSYRVRAADAAGNLSGYSNTATATTASAATAPVAAFSGSPTAGTAPLTVNFASASTGTISTYAWNFGDGTTSSVQNPSHVYSAAGVYTVSLTVSGSAGSNTKTLTNYVSVTAPPAATSGALTAQWVLTSGTIDLTKVGTSDWALWPGNIRNAGGGNQVSNAAVVGGGSATTYSSDKRTMTWSNGSPTASGSTTNGVQVAGIGNGFRLTAPADTTTRTLKVYVGAQNGSGQLTAHLSDGSAADYVQSFSAAKARNDGVFTLTYRAASAGQNITVTWVQTSGRKGNVSVQAAALAGGSTSTPPPTGTTCPCSIWSSSSVPTFAADADSSPVELGVKFQSDVAGYITGIRFYKSTTNTGTHVGSLWTSGGTLLAQATFTSETASGWQQVNFSTPVAIAANTVYIASYHTNTGHYANDDWAFVSSGVDNPPLHALRDGVSGGNGVYTYSGSPTFPSSSYNATNYWVDVVFAPTK